MRKPYIGVLGATSLVGQYLLPLLKLQGWQIVAFSRSDCSQQDAHTRWVNLSGDCKIQHRSDIAIEAWICLAPIWVLPQYFQLLETYGARVIVALSSTSGETKMKSQDAAEQALARALQEGEATLQKWAIEKNICWTILRPTLIYGGGKDKNIAAIARIIQRFGFFPLVGAATGLRQPIHAEDVAQASAAALHVSPRKSAVYHLSGGETLSYRKMVERVFLAMGRRAYMPSLPLGVFRIAISCMRLFPGYRHWSSAMAHRMSKDQIFDHTDATQDFGFAPRPFTLEKKDLPA